MLKPGHWPAGGEEHGNGSNGSVGGLCSMAAGCSQKIRGSCDAAQRILTWEVGEYQRSEVTVLYRTDVFEKLQRCGVKTFLYLGRISCKPRRIQKPLYHFVTGS